MRVLDQSKEPKLRRRLSRSRYRTLRRLVEEIPPYWAVVHFHHHSRRAIERWGFAEFRPLIRRSLCHRALWMAKLTPAGIALRDKYHKRYAERLARRVVKQ